jgi:hypothetical protein
MKAEASRMQAELWGYALMQVGGFAFVGSAISEVLQGSLLDTHGQ